MRILITGANGFIAREIIARLYASNHEIIASVHHDLLENVPHHHMIKMDFTKATQKEDWLPHLKNIDAVINCVGVFTTLQAKSMRAIHYETPKALFTAADELKIKKVIQISALGIDKVDVDYAMTKLALEKFLTTLPIDSIIIRPGLVYGKGSYGGTSLFRGLCGLPFIIPLPGSAKQLQQPIHLDDLTLIVEKSLNLTGKHLLMAVGDEQLTVKNLLIKLRAWLGFKKAWALSIPDFFIKIGAKLGNFIPNSPLSETGIKMMSADNIANPEELDHLTILTDVKPRGFTNGLKTMVSSVQDRWHARLYFLRPLLRISIAFIWLFSGIISLFSSFSFDVMNEAHIPMTLQPSILYSLSGLDILLGFATLFNYRLNVVGAIQCSLIMGYTFLITYLLPQYWLHPFAPLAKNFPLLVAIFIMMALESER